MESLRSLSSRLLLSGNDDEEFVHEPDEPERKWAIQRCMELSEYNEEETVIMWIKKIKQSEHKQHRRLMVITDVRLFTARRGGSKKKPKFEVRREAHILALTSVQEAGLIIHINFRDFEVSFECSDEDLTQKILGQLYRNYTFYNPGFSGPLACKWLDQYKASQEADLAKKYPGIGGSLAPWERPARAFRSWAYFYKEANKDKLQNGLKSILRRPLDEMVVDDERWLHTKALGCQNSKTIHGAVLCVAFTLELLHGIEISDVKGDADLFFAVQTLLKYNTTLGSLVLDGCCDGPEWGSLMVRALAENPNCALKRFGLRNCRIGDKGVQYMIEGSKKMQRYPGCVYLTKANCSAKTMINFIQSLPGNAGGSSGAAGAGGLDELDISDNPLESKGTRILASRLIKDFHSLKMLNVERCSIECPQLLTAIETASTKGTLRLEELNLSYNKMTQQDGLILSRILAKTGTCAALGLAGCGLSGNTIAACLAALLSNDSLQFYARLDVSDNNVGCEAAIMFASIFVLTDRIMSLKLNNCDLTHEGMGYVLMSLLTQPRLKLLEVDCNCKRTEWNSGKYHVASMLSKLLEKCLNLERLSVKNDPERGFQVDLDQFLNTLKTNESLHCLDISGNSMTSDNLASLKEVVIRNQILRELYWDQNNITSKHVLGITHALKQNKALQLVEFPDKDFQKELDREKSAAKKMELQMIKKNFFRAVFENATTQGFQQSTTNYVRAAAKRGSFVSNRDKNEVYRPQVGGASLGLPQFGGHGPNAMGGGPPPNPMMGANGGGGMPPPNPMMGGPGGGGGFEAPPKFGGRNSAKGKKAKPPPNPMMGANGGGMPPPNPMMGGPGGGGMPPPNPMMGGPGGGSMPPPNPVEERKEPPSLSFRSNNSNKSSGSKKSNKSNKNGMSSKNEAKNSSKFNDIRSKFGGGKEPKKSPSPNASNSSLNQNQGGMPPPNPMQNNFNNNNQNNQQQQQNKMKQGGMPPPNPMAMEFEGGGNNQQDMQMMGGMPPNGMMGGPPNGMMMGNGMGGMPPDMNMMGPMGGMGGMPPMGFGGMPPDMNMMGMGGMPPNFMMGMPPPDMMMGGMGGMGGMPPPDMNMMGMGGMPPMGMPPMGGSFYGMPPMGGMGGMGGMPPNFQGGMPPNFNGGMPPNFNGNGNGNMNGNNNQ